MAGSVLQFRLLQNIGEKKKRKKDVRRFFSGNFEFASKLHFSVSRVAQVVEVEMMVESRLDHNQRQIILHDAPGSLGV